MWATTKTTTPFDIVRSPYSRAGIVGWKRPTTNDPTIIIIVLLVVVVVGIVGDGGESSVEWRSRRAEDDERRRGQENTERLFVSSVVFDASCRAQPFYFGPFVLAIRTLQIQHVFCCGVESSVCGGAKGIPLLALLLFIESSSVRWTDVAYLFL